MEPLETLGRSDPKSIDMPLRHQGPLKFRKLKANDPWNIFGLLQGVWGRGYLLFGWDISWQIKHSLTQEFFFPKIKREIMALVQADTKTAPAPMSFESFANFAHLFL